MSAQQGIAGHLEPAPGAHGLRDRLAQSDASATKPAAAVRSLTQRIAGQGALLFTGFAAAQGFSFLRNALIGHGLSKGDFGIAATITLLLQLVETLSDLGTDRMIVQARDGDDPDFVATAHTTLLVRGALTALLLYFAAGPAAQFFAIPDVTWALQLVALVPLVKSFQHLDYRRAQRRYDNRPQILIEVLPQAAALAAALPLLATPGGYAVAVWLALLQATTMVGLSHLLAERPYRISANRTILRRFVAFGWPIWLSAFPLAAVFQGDRIIIGRMLGMEELAAYSAAFMITMVPGLVAAKVGHALMLPALGAARDDAATFARRFARLTEATACAAALYLALFLAFGGAVLPLAFGAAYTGLGAVAGWLAAMWSIRMLQAVPGMALMALGITRPFLTAGLIRSTALVLSLAAAYQGMGLAAIAAAGVAGEFVSLVYVAWRLDAERQGLMPALLLRALILIPAAALGLALALR